jgi:hypothetical protein
VSATATLCECGERPRDCACPNVCYGCANALHNLHLDGSAGSGRVNEPVFTDSRTGRSFCTDCAVCLITWEMDGHPEDPDLPYLDWIGEQ